MKKIIHTDSAPAPIGPYSQAVQFGNTLYTSGQIAIDPSNSHLIITSVEAEARQVMKNLEAVLTAADMTFENVVKSTIYLTDMSDFAKVNEIYGSHFDENSAPARETVEVVGLPKGVNVEISMIAMK